MLLVAFYLAGLVVIVLTIVLGNGASQREAALVQRVPSLPDPVRFLEMPAFSSEAVTGLQQTGGTDEEPVTINGGSYDTGYDTTRDAFSFRNYGSRFPQGNLTIAEVRELFGDVVCAAVEGNKCLPMPQTQFWINQMNGAMNGGHCVGFTILSRRLFNKQLTPADFTPGATVVYDVSQDIAVMRAIAQNWVLQVTDEVMAATVSGTPREIVDALLKLQQPVDLGIFGRQGGGHSMLAYALRYLGQGIFHIMVYDNNWPR